MNLLSRFDRCDIERRFAKVGLLDAVASKGFSELRVSIDDTGTGVPHVRLHGAKQGRQLLLLDACLSEAVVREPFFEKRGFSVTRPLELAVAFWVREQDPTVPFSAARPPLPLQEHPGLGVLPYAFRVIRDIAVELGKDGIAAVPKYFHDAYIFYHSRLFLFLDGREQGRFQRLLVDLAALPLGHASLAMLDGHVRDEEGRAVLWSPGYQVCPLGDQLTAYFNSGEYARLVDVGVAEHRYDYEAMNLLPSVIESTPTQAASDGSNDAEE